MFCHMEEEEDIDSDNLNNMEILKPTKGDITKRLRM